MELFYLIISSTLFVQVRPHPPLELFGGLPGVSRQRAAAARARRAGAAGRSGALVHQPSPLACVHGSASPRSATRATRAAGAADQSVAVPGHRGGGKDVHARGREMTWLGEDVNTNTIYLFYGSIS